MNTSFSAFFISLTTPYFIALVYISDSDRSRAYSTKPNYRY